MTHRYHAFLLRHWSLEEEQGTRIEVSHVATGASARFTSMNGALAWMQMMLTSDPAAARSPPGVTGTSADATATNSTDQR